MDEYVPKSQIRPSSQAPVSSSSPSSVSSIASNNISSPTNIRALSTIILNASSAIEDCGLLNFFVVQ
jgi:hypothetical protein